ncbi:hypothetical protein PISMIDRAFT_642214 [Pisolithus microcarpus 441]|uniref:Uncharacterized protein n=1 Tax=Pisolithus microcarpus 441 TaxID=765257 RepID=A0A0C9Z3M8_9AGAM|nr:hypothetical protein PISMIDRAFT_642214 [Pisolithus microcarpus 441]
MTQGQGKSYTHLHTKKCLVVQSPKPKRSKSNRSTKKKLWLRLLSCTEKNKKIPQTSRRAYE